MAKTPKQKILKFTERELAAVLDQTSNDAYKQGHRVGWDAAVAFKQGEIDSVRTTNDVLETVISGLHPAATALAKIAKGDGKNG